MKWWPFGKKQEPAPIPTMEAPDDPVAWIRENLGEYGPQIQSLIEPCIRFSSDSGKDPHLPALRIGGDPDVPDGFVWPMWEGSPLSFLAQFNLSKLPQVKESNLPVNGILLIFNDQTVWGFDPKDKGSTQVFWFEETVNLKRMAPPVKPSDLEQYREAHFVPSVTLSIPDPSLLCMQDLALPQDIEDQMYLLLETLREKDESPRHQLLGHPDLIQNEMQEECQVTSNGIYTGTSTYTNDSSYKALLGGHERDWILLAQIDSDDRADLMFGDLGTLYVWIRHQDLQDRRFDKCWTILQCS